jgi:hypothetical protein
VTFSDSAFVEFPFGLSTDPAFLRAAIFSAVQDSQGRKLAAAFNTIVEDVLENFQTASRLSAVIYVTNGPTEDSNTTLASATANLLQNGTEVFTVAVGNMVSQSELLSISPRIYAASNYAEIATVTFASQFVSSQCMSTTSTTTTSTTTTAATTTLSTTTTTT